MAMRRGEGEGLAKEQEGNRAARACLSVQRKAFQNLVEGVCSELRREDKDKDEETEKGEGCRRNPSVSEKSSWPLHRKRAFPRGQLLYGRPYPLTVVTMDKERRVFLDGAVLVVGDSVHSVCHFSKEWESKLKEQEEDSFALVNLGARGPRVLLPGLINTHVHTAQQLARGIADDVDLLTWLHHRMWPYESCMSREDHFLSSLLCSLELIRSGVTTFAEAGGPWPEAEAKAVEITGLRCCLARSTMDCGEGLPENWRETTEECLQRQIDLYNAYHLKAEGRIKVWFGLRQILNNSDELILRTREEAEKRGTGCHMHVSEITFENTFVKTHRKNNINKEEAPTTKEKEKDEGHHQSDLCRGGTVGHLDALGCLYPGLLAAHSVWVDDKEVKMLAREVVKIAHCPAAAMKVNKSRTNFVKN
jgi:cytosine/adenosine deaminase-related metal-dependent hydrolase